VHLVGVIKGVFW